MKTTTEEFAAALDELRYALNAAKPMTIKLADLLRRRSDLNASPLVSTQLVAMTASMRGWAVELNTLTETNRQTMASLNGIPAP